MRRAVLVACGLWLSACGEPLQDAARESLGPERPGVPTGELHRPGQPCLLCHDGSASRTVFTLAGTIYGDSSSQEPAEGVEVRVIDYVGTQALTKTNAAGNFYFDEASFEPKWPVWVKLAGTTETREMSSPIYREGSCSACHRGAGDPSHPEQVHLVGRR